MKLSVCAIALACASSVVAVPPGALYARRLPNEFNEALVERANGGSGKSDDGLDGGRSYTFDSNTKDPVSNKSIPYPVYRALSDFDRASFQLSLYQEWIELDLFYNLLARFSDVEFEDAGLGAQERSLIQFFAHQEINHATLLSNILGPGAAQQCKYQYPYNTVREAIDFVQRLTRWGESGVYGFLSQLNSGDSATLLTQSIATEARQQYTFRQFAGAFPVPESFIPGIPQAWAWTLLAPYITSCPSGTPKISWSNFPALNLTRDGTTPSLVKEGSKAAISTNTTTPIIAPGDQLSFSWEDPGKTVGPDGAYKTAILTKKPAAFACYVTHINATYTPLENVSGNSATTFVPDFITVFPNPGKEQVAGDIGVLNSTGFVVLTDAKVAITPANLTLLNAHIVAGPQMIQFG